jgi:hypothetical protein
MTIDYYTEAESIAQTIASQGHAEEARLLRDSIECGSTASEILMVLRFRLSALDAGGIVRDELTVERVRQLVAALNNELS